MDEPGRRDQQPSHHGVRHHASRHRRAEEIFPARDGARTKSAAALRSPSRTPAATCNRSAPRRCAAATITSSRAARCSSPTRAMARCWPSRPRPIRGEARLRRHQHVRGRKERRTDRPSARNLKKLGYKGIDTCEVLFDELAVPGDEPDRRRRRTGLQAGDERARSRTHQRGRARGRSRAGGIRNRDSLRAAAHRLRQTDLRASGGAIAARRHGHARRSGAADGRTMRRARRTRASAATSRPGWRSCSRRKRAPRSRSTRCACWAATASWQEFPVERFYRDAPLMMIGEGTNEIQALVIARGLLARYPA